MSMRSDPTAVRRYIEAPRTSPTTRLKQGGPVTAEEVIRALRLEPHPEEGGYYRETYRSESEYLPGLPFDGTRSTSTGIYYLLTADTYSAMHRLPGDEMFHFYLGDPVQMLMLLPDGNSETVVLGPDLATMHLQHVVPGDTWQGSRLLPGGAWALLGTTMAPGFAFSDYENGTAELIESFPERASLIESLLLPSTGDERTPTPE